MIAVKPKIVLISVNDTENRGYAVFDCEEEDTFEKELHKRGDAQYFYFLIGNRLVSKKQISSSTTDSRQLNFGVKLDAAAPPAVVAEKLADANTEVKTLEMLVASNMAEKSRLLLAKSLQSIAEGGLRLKYSSEGVENYPLPTPEDRGNVWMRKSCSALVQKNDISNKLQIKLGARVSLLVDDDIRYHGGRVVKEFHNSGKTVETEPENIFDYEERDEKEDKKKKKWKDIKAVDIELYNGTTMEKVPIENVVMMDNQMMIRTTSRGLDYAESVAHTLVATNNKTLKSDSLVNNLIKRIEVLKKAADKSNDSKSAEKSSVQNVLDIAAGKERPTCPICLDEVGKVEQGDDVIDLSEADADKPAIAMLGESMRGAKR